MKSPWTILVLGVVTFALVLVGMLAMMTQYERSPEGSHAKIANEIAETYGLAGVGADYDETSGVRVFTITYVTEKDTNFDSAAQETEMRLVAIFAFKRLDDRLKKKVDEIRVNRSEIHGSGCWENVYKTSFAMPNPDREEKPEGEAENP